MCNASKGAVRIFTKAAALQYAHEGIRVNSVHPDPIDTDMAGERLNDPELQRRAVRPEEVAYGVLYLASDELSFVIGNGLVIDGGVTAE